MSINYFRPIVDGEDCVFVDKSNKETERAATPTTTHLVENDGYLTPKNSSTHPENTLPVPSYPNLISNHVLETPEFLLMSHPLPDRDSLAPLKNPFIMALFKDDLVEESINKRAVTISLLEDQIVTVNRGELRGSVGRGMCIICSTV